MFKNSKNFHGIHFTGPFLIKEKSLFLLEGFLADVKEIHTSEDLNDMFDNYSEGSYNYILYNSDTKMLNIKNDRLGQYSLYFYNNNGKFVAGNNLWNILSVLEISEIIPEIDAMKEWIFLHRISEEGGTYFKGVRQLPASKILSYSLETKKTNEYKYWRMVQEYDHSIQLNDAIGMLDNAIHRLFDYLENSPYSENLAFGNSGGLDSRIIPIYSKDHGLNIRGYTIGDSKQRGILSSISHRNALQISKHLNFPTISIESKTGNYTERILLDIRNNPLAGNQVFKNPFEHFPDYDAIICGGNGFIVSNDSNAWKKFEVIDNEKERFDFIFNYLSKEKLSGHYSNQIRVRKFLNVKYNQNDSEFLLHKWYTEDERMQFMEKVKKYYNYYSDLDNFSLIRNVHLTLLNKQSPNGGLESLNRTKRFFYLYYPFALNDSLKWPSDFFYDRKVITGLIMKKDPVIAAIYDQKVNRIGKKTGKTNRLLQVAFRGSGMESSRWVKQFEFYNFANGIFTRNNDLFNQVVNDYLISTSDLYKTHPFFWMDVLKLKKICDIIYFQEYNFLEDKRYLMK